MITLDHVIVQYPEVTPLDEVDRVGVAARPGGPPVIRGCRSSIRTIVWCRF
jgi:hypothetical protein